MTHKEPVLVLNVPSVGLTLKVQADIEGKQLAYRRRISDDHDEKNLQVDYSANVDCSFNGKAYRVGGEPVRLLPLFFETRYFFRGDFEPVDGKRVKSVRVDHRLASVADSFDFSDGTLVGTLDFINEPGRFRLDLVITLSDDSERTVRFEFVVVSVKMNVLRDYGEIVNTIEKAKPNIVRAFLSKTFWGARLDDAAEGDAKSWYEILIDVFGFYESACRRIIHDPHRRYVREEEWIRADRLRRWTPQTANRFFALPRDRQDCERFRTERIGSEIDTPENRFVLYTLKELSKRLRAFAASMKTDEMKEIVSKDWVDGIDAKAESLSRLARNPFFHGVSAFSGFRQQSLVLQKRAGYAQVLSAWLKLKQALKPGGDDIDVGYRPISALYEFWCFLKMREVLELKLGLGPAKDEAWQDTSFDGVLNAAELTDEHTGEGELCKIDVTFEKGGRSYLLSYQKTYSPHAGVEGATFAGLNPQRPDIVLSIAEGGFVYTYLFDAKYRIWTKKGLGDDEIDASPRVAIDDMHRYRDAILYRLKKQELKQEVIGAYVLYPGRPDPHLCKEYEKSIAEENIGAIPLMPGHLDQLERRLREIVKRPQPSDHLNKTITTRGTSFVVGEIAQPIFLQLQKDDEGKTWKWKLKGKVLLLSSEVLGRSSPAAVTMVKLARPLEPTDIYELSFLSFAIGSKWVEYNVV